MLHNLMKYRAAALAVCAALLLASCGGNGGAAGSAPQAQGAAQTGRYLETQLELPGGVEAILALRDDGGSPAFVSAGGNPGYYRWEDGAFARQDAAWLDELTAAPEWNLEDVAFGADGTVWALMMEYGDTIRTHVLRRAEGGFAEIPLEEEARGTSLALLDDGGFLLGGGQTSCCFGPDGKVRAAFGGYTFSAAASGGTAALADADRREIVFLAGGDGAERGAVPLPESELRGALLAPDGAAFCYADDSGLYAASPDSGELRRLADGNLCRMASETLNMTGLLACGERYLVAACSDGGSPLLLEYAWDANAPARPARTLRVASLHGSAPAREAAVAMQLADPSLAVEITQWLDGDGSVGVRDAIRAMNTALLAGGGADVYLLDEMPLRSYIEKGVLADLSALAAPYLADGEWLANVAEALRGEDGRLCAIVTRFGLPALWVPGEDAAAPASLGDLADASGEDGVPVFAAMHPQNLLERFAAVSSPLWSGDGGAIDEAALAGFLTQLGRLAAASPGAEYTERASGLDGSLEIPGFVTGQNRMIAQEILSARMLPEALSAFAHGPDPSAAGTLAALPGAAPDAFIPHGVAGINAKSALPDDAAAFVEAMCSEQVQSVRGNSYAGLPIQISALEAELRAFMPTGTQSDEYPLWTIGYGIGDGEPIVLPVDRRVGGALRDRFIALCRAAKTPCLPDPVLLDMIVEETRPFFEGSLTAEQAASAVAARAQAYLTE